MSNLWILTEEKPKTSVILSIIKLYCRDFGHTYTERGQITIAPVFENSLFTFRYLVENIDVSNIGSITIRTVSGYSSFFDFLVFECEEMPNPAPMSAQYVPPLMAIEETKTSDEESRNTGVYQRATKFPYIHSYYPTVRIYMLYNDELQTSSTKKPSGTSIFGTNAFLSIGIDIHGKDLSQWFAPYNSYQEIIAFKNSMRQAPAGNVPINITEHPDRIEISGRLAKPADAGNIGHDPNIGALSLIATTLRRTGWTGRIVITHHGVLQTYINSNMNNKFLYICKILELELEGISLNHDNIILPSYYWHYENTSEKIASIFLHIMAENNGMSAVYHNHAGCERGYFVDFNNQLVALPKKDSHGINLYLPDLVLYDHITNTVILIEGKQLRTMAAGLRELQLYDSIENEYIKPNYPGATIYRYLSIFGGNLTYLPDPSVLLYINSNGHIFVNQNAPDCIKKCFC